MKNIERIESTSSEAAQLSLRLRKSSTCRRRRIAPATAAWWFHEMRKAAERGCATESTSSTPR